MTGEAIVKVDKLRRDFIIGSGSKAKLLKAVNGVSFEIGPEETLGLVGESGSGKSTIGRMLVGLTPTTSGTINLFGKTITGTGGKQALASVRKRLQFIFQDPHAALNPRMRIGDAIAEPIDVAGGWSKKDRIDRISELLELVGLPRDYALRYPHEFSGGQRQRIVIARALALDPDFIVCDEAVAALDVSMQAQIVNLLLDLQDELGLSYLFIAHDLAVVRSVSTKVAVLYAGEIVEFADRKSLYENPRHPYTQSLLAAIPKPNPDGERAKPIKGEIASLMDQTKGCNLCSRCPHAFDRCREESPMLKPLAASHTVACHLYDGEYK